MPKRPLKQKTLKIKGAYPPLFDRLTDNDPTTLSENIHDVLLDFEGLKASVEDELTMILNTRHSSKDKAKEATYDSLSDYVLPQFYGLSDFSWFEVSSLAGRQNMAEEIAQTIEHFEPRFKNVSVKIIDINPHTLALEARLDGDITLGSFSKKVSFPILLENLIVKDEEKAAS